MDPLFSEQFNDSSLDSSYTEAIHKLIKGLDIWGGKTSILDLSSPLEIRLLNHTINQLSHLSEDDRVFKHIETFLTEDYEGLKPPRLDMLQLVFELQILFSELSGTEPPNSEKYLNFMFHTQGIPNVNEKLNIEDYSVDITEDSVFIEKLLKRLSKDLYSGRVMYYRPLGLFEDDLSILMRLRLNDGPIYGDLLNQALRFSGTCTDQVLAYIKNTKQRLFPINGALYNYLYEHTAASSTRFLRANSIIVDPTILQVGHINPFLKREPKHVILNNIKALFPNSFDRLGNFIGYLTTYLHLTTTLGLTSFNMNSVESLEGVVLKYEDGAISYNNDLRK